MSKKSSLSKSTPKSASKADPKAKSKGKVAVVTQERSDFDESDSDPEESLELSLRDKTVYWSPKSSMGQMVGWRIRIWDTKVWLLCRLAFTTIMLR